MLAEKKPKVSIDFRCAVPNPAEGVYMVDNKKMFS